METAAWIQALSSVLLLIVTGIYVYFTKKLVGETSNAFLSIEKFVNPQLMGCQLIVVNNGPGHALRVEVYVEMNNKEDCTPTKVKATGPNVLICGKKAIYQITDLTKGIQMDTPIYISYETQAGKKISYKWVHSVGGNSLYKTNLDEIL